MNTLHSKLSALAAALATNGLIMTGVIYLFALQANPHMSAISVVRQLVAHQWLI
jgi:mannose/fructose/N-acetylgalactosamine-specific phosphotransferase system component IID